MKMARYIGPDHAWAYGGKKLKNGELIPDPTGLMAKKSSLFETVKEAKKKDKGKG